jgi:hypothetical protein
MLDALKQKEEYNKKSSTKTQTYGQSLWVKVAWKEK